MLSPRTLTKPCRKCSGTCPPCRPWRCKFGKGRSLEECANDLERTTQDQIQRVAMNLKQAIKAEMIKESVSWSENVTEVQKSLSKEGLISSGVSDAIISPRIVTGAAPIGLKRGCSIPAQPSNSECSHIFLAIAASPPLIKISEAILKTVVQMPEVPEITSFQDYYCIWPHTVHLTIQAFGKVQNVDIPTIANYLNKNLELISPFYLTVNGMVYHEKLHSIGFKVQKESVQALREFKSNLSRVSCMKRWVKKNFSWERYVPVFSVLHTRSLRRSKYTQAGVPLSRRSIKIILRRFVNVTHMQEVYPKRDIQLCLASSSTPTTFYKNLLE